ncbi:MAG TPA: DUF2683 family protein [Candidatus Nanoarchaeia archaeon]|nr:DUF2683 family protein [Candidatus Nanoarchaeia archaeon]
MIKAKYALRTKSEAIDQLIAEYLDSLPEPPLRPEFIRRMQKRMRGPVIEVGTVKNLHKLITGQLKRTDFPLRQRSKKSSTSY